MRKVIYKYTLEVADKQVVKMPYGFKILTAQMQNGEICLWAEVNTDDMMVDVHVLVVGTGHPTDLHGYDYVGTVQPASGLVFHVYAS